MYGTFTSLLLLLGVAVALVWAFRRIKLPAILAYLCAGIIAGPHVMGWIPDPDEYHLIAELGIVLLLFSLGLEFSLPKMIAMRRLVFGLGAAQVLGSLLVFLTIGFLILGNWASALAVAGALALSSTAVVIKQLSESSQTATRRGQVSVAILLFQDIAVVPLLIVIPLLAGGGSDGSIAYSLLMAMVKGAAVIAVLMAVGKWILPFAFREIANQRTDELFVLATLLVALVAGGLTHAFGLSMALGAFLAGMMLGESKYKHQLEADIRPFRDILMGLFFTTVGMQLALNSFIQSLHWVLLIILGMALVKLLIIRYVAKALGERDRDAWGSAVSLFQMGEFGFVIVALASSYQLLSADVSSILIGVGVFSMAVTPLVIQKLQPLVSMLVRESEAEPNIEQKVDASTSEHQVLICGFGRVGQTVSRFLDAEGIRHIAVDNDPMRVQEAVAGGAPVYFGDSAKRDILRAVGAARVPLIIISFSDDQRAIEVLREIRAMNEKAYVIVRSRDDLNLDKLNEAGASQVVPDTLEASLMLISHVLSHSGIPIRRILSRLEQERRNHYGDMHGFYPGSQTTIDHETADKLEFLHAVNLPEQAWAVGQAVADLDWDAHEVKLKALRRDDVEVEEPASQLELRAGDVVLLSGKPRHVESAERWLLEG
ncbi:monovalent cation:proton antiporter family protein [Idiomarina aquatica]|uniref:Potassium transporter n=1 Tax=Idiomarina aquatica TaxID=1327752 RepID=A0AA94JCY3_9GAMM|nr:monovalent cation:proton antiporter family protein [Idiomarina aquatica]RUO43163.1 potassium transporter [Idiomarina aquatica]